MIYITGDTHGELDVLLNRKPPNHNLLTDKDKMIICGDFGFVFHTKIENGCYSDEYKLDMIEESYPCELLFVSGNHENFDRLMQYPDEERYMGAVKRIRKNIFMLRRGEVYEIEGKKFFTFGGAYSPDKASKRLINAWWPQELPSPEEYRHASENLKKHSYAFDYIITHTAPKRAVIQLGKYPDMHEAELSGFLDWIFTDVKFRQWFFGHWHVDKSMYDGKIIACLDNVYSLE